MTSRNGFDIIRKLPGWITGLIAFVTAVVGFIKLWQGDTGLVTIVLLVVGVVGGLGGCAYVAFKRASPQMQRSDVYSRYEASLHQLFNRLDQDHPRYSEVLAYEQRLTENISQSRQFGDTDTRKAERSEIINHLNSLVLDELGMSFSELYGQTPSAAIAIQEAKEDIPWQYPRWRRWALAGLVIIPLLAVSGAGYNLYQRIRPPTKTIILVADFDSPEPQKYRVTETVLTNLRQALEGYNDVEVKAMGRPITEVEGSAVARAEGKKHKATIVIWGWYGVTTETVPLSVHFEVLRSPESLPELGPEVKGRVQALPKVTLETFTLQSQLSSEMAYLSLFTAGMTRFAAEDWDGAIAHFSNALSLTDEDEPVSALDQGYVYSFRGRAYWYKGDFDQARADYDRAYARPLSESAKAYILSLREVMADLEKVVKIVTAWLEDPTDTNVPVELESAWERVITAVVTHDPMTVESNVLVAWVLREAYQESIDTESLEAAAVRIQFYNDVKEAIRNEIREARDRLVQYAGKDPDFAIDRYEGKDIAIEFTGSGDQETTLETPEMSRELYNGPEITTKGALETYLENLEEKLSTVSDDAQLANVDLYNLLQHTTQKMEKLTIIGEMLHDMPMEELRSLGENP